MSIKGNLLSVYKSSFQVCHTFSRQIAEENFCVWQCLFSIKCGTFLMMIQRIRWNVVIFWAIALCSLYVNWCFGGTYHFHLQFKKICWAKNQHVADCTLVSCSADFDLEDGWWWFTYGLYGTTSQKIATFIVTTHNLKSYNKTSLSDNDAPWKDVLSTFQQC
jgi:hypothetical protein